MRTLARADDKAELLRRLQALRADSRRRWGRMTAPQMVCHLSDAFRSVLGQRPVSRASSVLGPTLVKWVALYLPLPWPRAVIRTRPELDPLVGGTKPAEFAADLAELEGLVERFTATGATFEAAPHPLFGRMSDADWQRWGYLHVDHHLRQFGA